MIDLPLTSLEEVIDPPLTSLPLVAPSLSSTPRDTTEGVLRLLSYLLPLTWCTRLKMGESLRGDANCVEGDSFDWAGGIALLEPSFEEYCNDDVRVDAAPSIEHIDPIYAESLDLVPISFPILPTTPSHLHAFLQSLCDISRSQPHLIHIVHAWRTCLGKSCGMLCLIML